jgi:hypothetical protein
MSRPKLQRCIECGDHTERCEEDTLMSLADENVGPLCLECYAKSCPKCEGYGFLEVFSNSPPCFENCPVCENPLGAILP